MRDGSCASTQNYGAVWRDYFGSCVAVKHVWIVAELDVLGDSLCPGQRPVGVEEEGLGDCFEGSPAGVFPETMPGAALRGTEYRRSFHKRSPLSKCQKCRSPSLSDACLAVLLSALHLPRILDSS